MVSVAIIGISRWPEMPVIITCDNQIAMVLATMTIKWRQ